MAEGSEKKIRSRDRKNDPSRKISVKKGRTEVFSTVCENPPKKKNAPKKGALKRCFSHPDCTVGAGTSLLGAVWRSWTGKTICRLPPALPRSADLVEKIGMDFLDECSEGLLEKP